MTLPLPLLTRTCFPGTGSYKRMKDAMASHVDQERHTMFRYATEAVKQRLTQMCRAVEEQMSNKADEVFLQMRRDYMTTIGGAQLSQGDLMSKAERTMRKDVLSILDDADGQFKAVLKGEVEVVKEEEADHDSEQQGENNDNDDSDANSNVKEEEMPHAESSSAAASLHNSFHDEVSETRARSSYDTAADVKMDSAPGDKTDLQPDDDEL